VFWRKWLVRLLVFSLLGGFGAVGYLYQRWTDPAAVRLQVVAKLSELFPGAEVTLDAARMRLLGGIALSELRLVRRDDPDRSDLGYFPAAILYHDKEKLLGGELAIRKVELNRPRLRIIRGLDGHWNLQGLTGARGPGSVLPTIVINHGTVLLDDQLARPGQPPAELVDVNLTVLNGPAHTVNIQGSARSDLVGPLQVQARWQWERHEVTLTLKAPQMPIGPTLVQCLSRYFPEIGEHAQRLEGVAGLEAAVSYRPDSAQPWSHDLRWHLRQGKLHHPLLPVALEDLEAEVRCVDGQVALERLTARAGQARVSLTRAAVHRGTAGMDFEAAGRIEHLHVTEAVWNGLPACIGRYHELFHPAGPANISFEVAHRGGRWARVHTRIVADGMTATFQGFPYELDRIRGPVDVSWPEQLVQVDLTGYSGTRPVTVRGDWKGVGPMAAVRLDVRGRDIPLDRKLLEALRPPYREVVRRFHLTGLGDFDVAIRHVPGQACFANRYLVRVKQGTLKWDEFRYPLKDVRGTLDLLPDHWEFRDFQGVRNQGEFRASGRSYPAPPGHAAEDCRIAVVIQGSNVGLDKDLKEALDAFPCMARAWETFKPAGRMNFTTRIDQMPRQPQDLDVDVDVRGCAIDPTFFPYALTELSGNFHYGKNRLQMADVRARHGGTRVYVPRGEVALYASGGLFADLPELRADPVFPNQDFLKALPAALKTLCESLELRAEDALDLKTRLVVSLPGEPGSKPDIYWNGVLGLHDASVSVGVPVEHVTGRVGCVGRYNGYQLLGVDSNVMLSRATLYGLPFHDLHAKLDIFEDAPDVVVLALKAPLFEGQISGPGRIELNSTLRYELDLTASEVKLDALGRHEFGADSQLSGLVGGRLHLTGKGTGLASLEGNGSLDMPRGHLYNLPLLLDLLKFLGLRWPDKTAFDQAHAAFSIHGDRLSFSHLELYGNAISLHGQGDMKLDGQEVRLDFIPVWGRIEQVLPAAWQPIPSAIGKNLLKIEMRGKVGASKDLHFHKKPVPGLIEPLIQMRDRLAGNRGDRPEGNRGDRPAGKRQE
jgi:hypothetical protein